MDKELLLKIIMFSILIIIVSITAIAWLLRVKEKIEEEQRQNKITSVEDLRLWDLVELYGSHDYIMILADEWSYDKEYNTFVCDEDDCVGCNPEEWNKFDCISRVWRFDDTFTNFKLIYKKDLHIKEE